MKICKRFYIENKAELSDSIKVEALNKNPIIEQSRIKAENFYYPAGQIRIRAKDDYDPPLAQRPRTDLGKTSGGNPSYTLVRPVQVLIKLITETSSKVCESKTFDETVNNSINRNK